MNDTEIPEPEQAQLEIRLPRVYTIVADLGDQRAWIIKQRGLKLSQKFVNRLSRKYPTEAVAFNILRNPRPPTMLWRDMKKIVKAIVAAEWSEEELDL